MREMFGWVNFFSKLAARIAEQRPAELNERAKRIDWRLSGRSEGKHRLADEPLFGVEDVDPLTFFSYLATRTRYPGRLPEALANVGSAFGVGVSVEHCEDWKVLNVFNLLVAWARLAKDRELLWMIFRQAVAGQIEADTFRSALELRDVALPTLSTTLFLINPRSFLPLLDAPQYRHSYGLTSIPPRMPWNDYSAEIGRIKAEHPGCEFFEIELFHRLMRGGDGPRLVTRPDRCWLVSTNAAWGREVRDHWSEFSDNRWVRVEEKETYPVEKPEIGDIMLVRYGRGSGRGIGIVYRNDYKEGWSPERRIHALWLNKEPSALAMKTRATAFTEASADEVRSFRESSSYTPTWEILDRLDVGTIKYEAELRVWLRHERGLADAPTKAVISRLKRIQRYEGNLDAQFKSDTLDGLIKPFEYSKDDFHRGRDPRHLVPIDGDGYKGTASYQSALRRYLEFRTELAGDVEDLPRRTRSVEHPRNQILYGPPGTGKTYQTVSHALAIVDGVDVETTRNEDRETARKRYDQLLFRRHSCPSGPAEGQVAMVTFHQNYAYEDFVEGIRPRLSEPSGGPDAPQGNPASQLDYELRPGIFRRICEAAETAQRTAKKEARAPVRFVLIIDEINRGNIPKILGELITLIEDSRRLGEDDATTVTLPYSGDEFGVPDNLYIIGTMNTADRSIQQLDTALRRRFTFVEMMPDADHKLIPEELASNDGSVVNCRKMLRAMNERIALLMDREHQIGHTYLLEVESIEDLSDRFRNRIFPLLQEYFYDDWRRIDAVLGGNAFVRKDKTGNRYSKLLIEKLDLVDEDRMIHERLPDDDTAWNTAEEYQKIYEPKSG